MTDPKRLYDEDFVLWSRQQAATLRAAARGGANQPLDWENLAEEIEDLGKSSRRELRSQIRRIIRHLVKLEYSPATGPRRGWIESVNDAREEIRDLLEDSPSLRADAPGLIQAQLARGIRQAISDLEKQQEMAAVDLPRLRAANYTEEQVLGDWFPPELQGPGAARTRRRDMTDPKRLYDEDFALWAQEQAAALRAAAQGRSNEPLDWEHLAEEIEDLGVSQRHMIRSYISRIIQHLVKLEFSPAVEPHNGWRRTIRVARIQVKKRVNMNPSLRPELGRFVAEETRDAVELAIIALEEYEEMDEVRALAVRRTSFTAEQVLGDWFPEEPPRE